MFKRFSFTAVFILLTILILSIFKTMVQSDSPIEGIVKQHEKSIKETSAQHNTYIQEAAARQSKSFRGEGKTRPREAYTESIVRQREAYREGISRQREAYLRNLMKSRWESYRKIPGVSLPDSPNDLAIKTIEIPEIKSDENPNIEIIDALLEEGVDEEHAVKIAQEIINNIGIDAIMEGQVMSIVVDENNMEKPVLVDYSENPVESSVLLQTETNDYQHVENKEKAEESFLKYNGYLASDRDLHKSLSRIEGVSEPLSNTILPVLNNLTNGNITAGDTYYIGVKKDGTGTDKVLMVSYNGAKTGLKEAFFFQDEKGSPFNAFYYTNGSSITDFKYIFPLKDPYRKTDGFGMRSHPVLGQAKRHNGIDYAPAKKGTPIPVYSIADGTVVESSSDRSRGNYVIIKHADDLKSHYFHLNKKGIAKGSAAEAGQRIAETGSTGISTGNHLHLGIDKNGTWQDPENILGGVFASSQLSGDKMQKFSSQVGEAKKMF